MKRWVSIAVSLLILIVIYTRIDFAGLVQVFQQCDPVWMAISLGMVVPLTLLTAWRLQQLMPRVRPQGAMPRGIPLPNPASSEDSDRAASPAIESAAVSAATLSFGEANRLILAASVLNMVLPSKMGDLAKSYFMRDRGHLDGSLAFSLVVFEKACDMLSLLVWCGFGLLLYPSKDPLFWIMTLATIGGLVAGVALLSWPAFARSVFAASQRIAPGKMRRKLDRLSDSWQLMHNYFWSDRRQLAIVTLTSIVIWFLHLLQIWFFILALRAFAPFLANLALSPLAILAGLLPLTFAGVGTRDAALILFYQPYFAAPIGAALGLLCTSRYLLPAIGGLPFLGQYLLQLKRWQQPTAGPDQ
ncbi:flippase-like domain-containing protein [Limnothrix sp. FACHB-881]|uniref:lysylphosphatidylglycerol synthase transmembrane domain-containing protein n=1 Tax=unclassified Limnothrix TaxID=2632864 RepID=UPI0016806EA7|nr:MULTISPECIES: lysylphosphatidylglycerol synthase transmembrane domain-containing protein [unclassified Limnothrix]MBD2159708.1 flippase-like domain-containing protein [Limnothrix sp. FACHB-1083]MBD2190411.1 flippase-like domain-containing protein [Limnothrix sp. FACHB-1088]MBD2634283.1 flippase-like domain-containing protein [Limnothrix sp. FACHB-881]